MMATKPVRDLAVGDKVINENNVVCRVTKIGRGIYRGTAFINYYAGNGTSDWTCEGWNTELILAPEDSKIGQVIDPNQLEERERQALLEPSRE